MLAKGKGRVEGERRERSVRHIWQMPPSGGVAECMEWNKGDKVKAPDKCSEDE